MIVVDQLTKRYDGVVVVDDVAVELAASGITAVVGPNGAGKSTLLSLVSRLLAADAGTVTVDGLDVTRTPGDVIARRLAILRQENHLVTRLTVRELVGFGRYPHSRGRLTAADREHVDRALEYLDLVPLSGRFLDELSGGQRQRAFIAMVIAQDTEYVLLDEPLNNLDLRHAVDMMKLLERAAADLGKKVVIVVHDINFASHYADHVVAMRDGRVLVQGPPDHVFVPDVLREVFDVDVDVQVVAGRRVAVYYR